MKKIIAGLTIIILLIVQSSIAISLTETEQQTWNAAIEFLESELKEPLYYYDTKEIQTTTLNFERANQPNIIYILDKEKKIIYDGLGQHINYGKGLEFIPQQYFETKELTILERNNLEYLIKPIYEKETLQGYIIVGIEKKIEKKPISLIYLFFGAFVIILLMTILKKHSIIKLDRNYSMVLLGIALTLIISVFVFNAYQIAENMETNAIQTFEEQQVSFAEKMASDLEHDIDIIMDDMVVTADDPTLTSEDQKKVYFALQQMQERLKGSLDSSYLLDEKGIVIARIPIKEGYEKEYRDFSEKPGVKEVIETKEPSVSELFKLSNGETAFSIVFPIFKNGEFKGILRTNILLNTILKRYLQPLSTTKTGEAHLIIGDQMYNANGQNLAAKQEIIREIVLGKANSITRQQTFFYLDKTETTEAVATYHPIKTGENYWAVAIIVPKQTLLSRVSENINKIWQFTFGMVASILLVGVTFDYLFTKSLRKEITNKTHALNTMNIRLEKTVKKRTQQLNVKSAQLGKLNTGLEKEIDKKTRELGERLKKEEKATKAMVYLLEKQKQAKEMIEVKNVQVNAQTAELKTTNQRLRRAQKALEEEKRGIEKKVDQRTRELKKANSRIKKLLHVKATIRESSST